MLVEQGGSVSTQFIADRLVCLRLRCSNGLVRRATLLQTAILIPSKASKASKMLRFLCEGPTEEPVREQMEQMCLRLLKFFDEMLPSLRVYMLQA